MEWRASIFSTPCSPPLEDMIGDFLCDFLWVYCPQLRVLGAPNGLPLAISGSEICHKQRCETYWPGWTWLWSHPHKKCKPFEQDSLARWSKEEERHGNRSEPTWNWVQTSLHLTTSSQLSWWERIETSLPTELQGTLFHSITEATALCSHNTQSQEQKCMVTSEGMCIPRVYNASQEPEVASHDLASMTCNVDTPCELAHCSKLGESLQAIRWLWQIVGLSELTQTSLWH